MPELMKASRVALGVGAAVAIAAALPAGAIASPHVAPSHHAASHHHGSHHAKHVTLSGLVAKHSGRHVTVFAKTVKAGARTMHNKRVAVTFARSVHHNSRIQVGDRIHIAATARISGHHITVLHHNDETVTPAPASLVFGTVSAVNGNFLTVAELNRDNGDNQSGDDNHDGGGWGSDTRKSPAHSPGGPGGGDNSGHQIVVDDTNATITVDGSTDTALAVGDTVAILGEVTSDTLVAADIFGYTSAPDFLRGDITAIDGPNVTLGGDNSGGDATPADHGGDGGDDNGQSVTVDLTNVPLALNGDSGASPSDLVVGDKLIVIGAFDATSNIFTPDVAFAFNGDDNNPCGHNDGGDDGGSDD